MVFNFFDYIYGSLDCGAWRWIFWYGNGCPCCRQKGSVGSLHACTWSSSLSFYQWESLMESIGASEKVFQLMDLLPSDQFMSKGKQFINLKNVSHDYIVSHWIGQFLCILFFFIFWSFSFFYFFIFYSFYIFLRCTLIDLFL